MCAHKLEEGISLALSPSLSLSLDSFKGLRETTSSSIGMHVEEGMGSSTN